MVVEKLGPSASHTVNFFSFSQDRDSVLNCEDGRHRLKEVGIGTPLEVAKWLVKVFRIQFGQEDLADQLYDFMHKTQSTTPPQVQFLM